jgi:hypothetical protein
VDRRTEVGALYGFGYIGDNPNGEPIRVHYFPGARVPPPSQAIGE